MDRRLFYLWIRRRRRFVSEKTRESILTFSRFLISIFRDHRDTREGNGKLKITMDRNRPMPFMEEEDSEMKMKFGDSRGDVHPAFTVLHTVFLRLHNILAEKLKQVNPHWNDEKLFQEARKIVGALIQHITYTQYLNILLGPENGVSLDEHGLFDNSYDPEVDGTIHLVFSTAAYRFVKIKLFFFLTAKLG